jgi:hypothetical protein
MAAILGIRKGGSYPEGLPSRDTENTQENEK